MNEDVQTNETTEVSKAAQIPQTERYGEVEANPDAETHHLQEQTAEERLDAAKRDAIRNHAAEHANDEADYETMVSNDRVESSDEDENEDELETTTTTEEV